MIRLLITALTLTMLTGVATADRRGNHRGTGHDKGSVIRDHRTNGLQHSNRPAHRSDRRVVNRGPVRAKNGRFVFAGGVTHVYTRPVIRTRYYDARVRPAYIVESYPRVPGYIWVRGGWTWSGSEWRWGGGYYAADPQYRTFYSDGSFDVSLNVRIGG